MGIDPTTHKPRTDPNHLMNLSMLLGASADVGNLMSPWGNGLGLQADPSHLARIQLLQNLLQVVNTTSTAILNNPFEGFINGWGYMNPGILIPQAPTNSQEIDNSWANIAQVDNIGVKNSSLSENPLIPALVSEPPLTDHQPNQFSTSIFEDWEKLMDDETSDSYWKDMLE